MPKHPWEAAVTNDSSAEVISGTAASADSAAATDPLPSWNDGPAKQSILSFVEKVTTESSPYFVPIPERIATFDNDGTLWCEKPAPVQAYFALDRVKALFSQHPEWETQEPFASLLHGDLQATLVGGDQTLLEIVMATHAGMSTAEFGRIVEDWIATARHPQTGRLFTEMTYQPMLELLAYLRANGFRNYIVTGGGIEFVRQWGERIYGVTPEQVIGSSIKTKFELRDGKPVLMRLPHLNFNNDKAGKPVTIHQHIGRAPTAAFGNSVGDRQMLEYTTGSDGARFGLLVLHDDAAREYAYGPALGLPEPQLGAFTPAREVVAGHHPQPRRERLEQKRHDVRHQQDPEQRVAEPRPTLQVRRPVARVHVADAHQIRRPQEREQPSKPPEPPAPRRHVDRAVYLIQGTTILARILDDPHRHPRFRNS